jgi:hypothetical protein
LYCDHCGVKIDSEDLFCSGCGKRLESKPSAENSDSEMGNSGSRISASREHNYEKTAGSFFKFRKTSIQKYFFQSIRIIALIYILGVLPIVFSTFALSSSKYPDADKNIRLCEQIAADYCSSHTYSKDDVYDCDNMAQDIWNMLKAKGINARIAVGYIESADNSRIADENTVHKESDSGRLGQIEIPSRTYGTANLLNSSAIESFNHAWVLAEVYPGSWLAIECTAGYTVYMDENENYYQGLTFSNPRNYRSFLSLYRDWKAKSLDYENERQYYNELIRSYNNASASKQTSMESGIKVAQRELYEKEKALLKTDSELNALLKYG